jgi:hypothetical protein
MQGQHRGRATALAGMRHWKESQTVSQPLAGVAHRGLSNQISSCLEKGACNNAIRVYLIQTEVNAINEVDNDGCTALW